MQMKLEEGNAQKNNEEGDAKQNDEEEEEKFDLDPKR